MANGRDGTLLDFFINRARDTYDSMTNKREEPKIKHVPGEPLKSYHLGKVKGGLTPRTKRG
jgi:hypothetical protein